MKSSPAEGDLWVVILAGGAGTRFWPVSTPARPKQLLPLAGPDSLIRETLDRITPTVPLDRIRILTGRHLGDLILEELPELGEEHLLVEPTARGTAPVLAWAAHTIARVDPGAVMVSLHADHAIRPAEEFRALLGELAELARSRELLFTLGIEPTRAETGYGYIQTGEPLGPVMNAYRVADFVEKPDRDTAQEYLRRGGYLWNSGIFVWRVDVLLSELDTHTPEIATLLPLLDEGEVEEFFRRAPRLSIDEGLLERSRSVAVTPASFEWDDVGAWDAIARGRKGDAAGNVCVGSAHLQEARGCITWSEEGSVVVFGATRLVVVHLPEVTLVVPRERAAELKSLVESLPPGIRDAVAERTERMERGEAPDG